ncbi:hypothetical protein V2W45_1410853 [Cenococcum geophilum]
MDQWSWRPQLESRRTLYYRTSCRVPTLTPLLSFHLCLLIIKPALFSPMPTTAASLILNLRGPKYPKGIACGLNVGFHTGSKSRYTLETIGRNGADITVEGPSHGSTLSRSTRSSIP